MLLLYLTTEQNELQDRKAKMYKSDKKDSTQKPSGFIG